MAELVNRLGGAHHRQQRLSPRRYFPCAFNKATQTSWCSLECTCGSSWCPLLGTRLRWRQQRFWGKQRRPPELGWLLTEKYWKLVPVGEKLRVNRPHECNCGSLGCKTSTVTPPLWRREGVPDYLAAAPRANSPVMSCGCVFFYQWFFGDRGGITRGWNYSVLKAFLPSSAPFRQGLNCSGNNCCNEQRQSAADRGRLQRGCSSRRGGTFIIPKMSTRDWDGQPRCDFLLLPSTTTTGCFILPLAAPPNLKIQI